MDASVENSNWNFPWGDDHLWRQHALIMWSRLSTNIIWKAKFSSDGGGCSAHTLFGGTVLY
jgi:hypothetical protein